MSRALLLALLVPVLACSIPLGSTQKRSDEPEVVLVRAADGAAVVLLHRKPAIDPVGVPVLLIHGVAANAHHMDLNSGHSLARWFAGQGRDAWVVSLRGTGQPFVPDSVDASAQDQTTIDSYATLDLPAAIAAVKARTGAPSVDVVAHSMGGLVLYAYLARGGTQVHAAAVLGSPVRLRLGDSAETFIQEKGESIGARIGVLPNERLSKLSAKAVGKIPGPVDQFAGNPPVNTSWETLSALVEFGSADVPGGVLRQFQRSIARDGFVSADGSIDYVAKLAEVRTPVMVVAGKIDRICLVDGAKAAYQRLGGPKRFEVIGVHTGAEADYGHADLIVGDAAPLEVWPKLEQWFTEQR